MNDIKDNLHPTPAKFGWSGGVNTLLPYLGYYSYYIEKVIYRNPVTVIIWSDGTKTICKCSAQDHYNPETGLAICMLKKLYGNENSKNVFKYWLPEDGQTEVTLKEVRYREKHIY